MKMDFQSEQPPPVFRPPKPDLERDATAHFRSFRFQMCLGVRKLLRGGLGDKKHAKKTKMIQ